MAAPRPEVSRYLAKAMRTHVLESEVTSQQIIDQAESAQTIEDIQEPVKSWAIKAIKAIEDAE
jgi:hypothetical protein